MLPEQAKEGVLDFGQIAREAIGQMPPETRFNKTHAETLVRHKDELMAFKDEFVKGFYDILFAHPPTAKVFEEGERAERESTLGMFYERVLAGPHDEEFFAWLAFVGPVHVVRGVTNPMMLAMTSYMVNFVRQRVKDHPEGDAILEAFVHLAATLGAIIAYGYEMAWKKALENVVGIPPTLSERAAHEEAKRLFPLRSHQS